MRIQYNKIKEQKKMDVSKTQKGKPCKKCIAKGEPCHLHWTFRNVPIVSSLPSYQNIGSTRPVCLNGNEVIPFLDVIPTLALYIVLLYLEPNTLNFICRVCRRAFNVSLLPRFREDYLKKHKLRNLIQGCLVLHCDMRDRGAWSYGKFFADNSNNKIWIFVTNHRLDKIVYKHHKSDVAIVYDARMGKLFMKSMKWIQNTDVANIQNYIMPSIDEMTAFLFEISRPNWYPGYTGNFKNKNRQRQVISEFLAQIEPCIIRIFPEYSRKGRII